MASKGGREKIKLESSAGTGHFYTTSKNKKTMPEKMAIMKFDPKARKHVEYKETKLKRQGLRPVTSIPAQAGTQKDPPLRRGIQRKPRQPGRLFAE